MFFTGGIMWGILEKTCRLVSMSSWISGPVKNRRVCICCQAFIIERGGRCFFGGGDVEHPRNIWTCCLGSTSIWIGFYVGLGIGYGDGFLHGIDQIRSPFDDLDRDLDLSWHRDP